MISTWFKKREVKTILAGFLLLYYIQAHTLTSKNVSSFSYEKDKLHFLNNWMTFKTGGYGGIILVMRNLKLLMYIKWISYICIQLVWKNLALILKITLKGKMHATCRCQAINHTVQSYIIHSKNIIAYNDLVYHAWTMDHISLADLDWEWLCGGLDLCPVGSGVQNPRPFGGHSSPSCHGWWRYMFM